jgi:hypothetical protein
MNPTPKGRGLRLARNDKAAASGCMTAARQGRNPAACASSEAYGKHVTLAPFPARNRQCSVGNVLLNRCPRRAGVPEHTDSLP